MKIRAAVFDVYRTILDVLPPPADAAERWLRLKSDHAMDCALDLSGLDAACRKVVAEMHAAARTIGVNHPEILWTEVMVTVIPSIRTMPDDRLRALVAGYVLLLRTLRLMPGAGAVLSDLVSRGVPMGIASNAQEYTLQDLAGALAETGLTPSIFEPDVLFWSFQNGFSKPDPHVFRILTHRLALRGIRPGECLMVGDRLDNDVNAATVHGWRAWHLCPPGASSPHPLAGDWTALGRFLKGRV